MAFQPSDTECPGQKGAERARSQRGDGSLYGEQGIVCAKVTKDPREGGPCWPEENLRLLPGGADELQGAGNSWGPSALA